MAQTFINNFKIKYWLITGLIIRLLIAPLTYHGDVIVNYWWGKFAVEFNLRGYYNWLEFGGYAHPDQPMLYIYYYRFIRQIYLSIYNILWYLNINISLFPSKLMQWYFEKGNYILEKIPIILFEIFLIFLVYKFSLNHLSKKAAINISLTLIFYLPYIYNSSVWGGNDILLNLLGLSSLYLFFNKNYFLSALSLSLCFMFKTSLLFILPVFFVMFLKNRPKLHSFIFAFVIPFLIMFYIFSKPFSINNTFLWLYEVYTQKILVGSMPFLTANAMNFWGFMFGLNPILDSSPLYLFGNFRILSLILVASLSFIPLIKLWKTYNLMTVLYSVICLTMITFTFLTRMHERYTFPALLPLLLLSFYDRKFLKYFIVLSLTHLINVYNWWYVPKIDLLINLLDLSVFIKFISFINIFLTLKLLTLNVKK